MRTLSLFSLLLAISLGLSGSEGVQAAELLFIRDGNIWTCTADGQEVRAITNSGLYWNAQWTGRGQSIAGFVLGDEGVVRRVNVMSETGVFQAAIPGEVLQIADTPQGRTIALVQRSGARWEALEVPSRRSLTGLLPGVMPSLSPDGHTVVYQIQSYVEATSLPSSVLWLADLNALGRPRRLSPPLGKRVYEGNASYARYFDQSTEFLCWSPDGSRLVCFRYVVEGSGASGHFLTPVTQWSPTPLAQLGVCSEDFQWRPGAQNPQLAATHWGRHGPTWAVLVEGEQAWSLPGLAVEGWDGSPLNSRSLGWSPGGRYLLTAADDDGWVAITDLQTRQELPHRLEMTLQATIAGTEQTIAFVQGEQVYVQTLASLIANGTDAATKIGAGRSPVWRR